MARPPRAGAVVAVALAAIAASAAGCIGGELGTVGATATLKTDVRLSADAPVAVRHLTFSATSLVDVTTATITIRAVRVRDDGVREAPDGVTISVRPDDPALITWQAGHPDESLPGAVLSLLGPCRENCRSGLTVVVRGDPGSAAPGDIRVLSELQLLSPSRPDRSFGAVPAIIEDSDRRIDGSPPSAVASAVRDIVVGPGSDVVRITLRIHADATTLGAARRYPLVGSVTVRGVGDSVAHAALSSYLASGIGALLFHTSKTGVILASEGNATDVDWLSRCPATGDCDLAFELTFSQQSLLSTARVNAAVANIAPPSLPASFRLELQATAILEAFDGRTLDPAGLTVTMETTR